MSKKYRNIAKQLEVKYLFGHWGIQWFTRYPGGHLHKIVSIIPLDGWITDPKEVERVIRKNGMEL